jgi:hypothetical protein
MWLKGKRESEDGGGDLELRKEGNTSRGSSPSVVLGASWLSHSYVRLAT